MRPHFRRPSHGTIAAYLALFVALGGTSYAVTSLPKNSVGSAQIRNHSVKGSDLGSNSITTSKVKNGSLRAGDFAAGQLPSGPTGPAGATGPAGPAGTARAYGRVEANGVVDTPHSSGLAAVTHPLVGVYCISPDPARGIDVNTTGVLAIPDPHGAYFKDQNPEVEWDSLRRDCPVGSLEVNVFVDGANNPTLTGNGDDSYRQYSHVFADGPFFFIIP